MTQKVLVTGVNGFVGHHVAELLARKKIVVFGVSNQPYLQDDLRDYVSDYIGCDLVDPEQVRAIDLKNVTAIINLAGFAQVGSSQNQGELYNKVNVGVHTVLYDECLRQNVSPRIIAVSTGAVYDPNQNLPISENSRIIAKDATNEYVISKQLMEESLELYRQKGLKIIVARPFNHTGPGQLPGFLLPDLLEQIKQAQSSDGILRVGNLKTKRDYTDVRDVAKAYILLATEAENKIKHDTYNICSGTSAAGEDILKILLSACSAKDLEIMVDPEKLRKNDVLDIFGSFERIHQDIGWAPTITLKDMVCDFVSWSSKHA